MSGGDVSVVVLTYNGWHLAETCLSRLAAQDPAPLEIILVDNGSREDLAARARHAFPGLRSLRLETNRGYAGGNNAGAAAARGAFVALVSDDVEVGPHFVRDLRAAFDGDPNVVLAGPAVDNDHVDPAAYPGHGTLGLTGNVIHNVLPDGTETFGAPGCALMYRADRVGRPFDPDYHCFHEEIQLAWRMRLLGWKVVRVPGTRVRHRGGATVGGVTDANRFFLERNRRLNLMTCYAPATRRRVRPLLVLADALAWLGDVRAGRSRRPIRDARGWLAAHRRNVEEKRRSLQRSRRVGDEAILRWMSCRVTNQPGPAGRFANRLAALWCRAVGLRTYEHTGSGS